MHSCVSYLHNPCHSCVSYLHNACHHVFFILQIDRENKIFGIFPRIRFDDKATYTESMTKKYDMVTMIWLSLILLHISQYRQYHVLYEYWFYFGIFTMAKISHVMYSQKQIFCASLLTVSFLPTCDVDT
jgi:hypothetical protein